MPHTRVFFYREHPGQAPVVEWLKELRRKDQKGYAKCVAHIRRLVELGHELRRPEADFLRDGMYELRAKKGRVNYRILYFFHGQNVAVLGHAIIKEGQVPEVDLERVVRRKTAFERDPERHAYEEEVSNG